MVSKLKSLRKIRIVPFLSSLKKNRRYKNTVKLLQKRPFLSFFGALGLLLLVIILGSVISGLNKKTETTQQVTKKTDVYSIGQAPKVTLQAQVTQEGVVEIVAQTPGVVSEVFVWEGEQVTSGQTLVQLSTNYQGGNALALQASLAGLQYKNVKETYDTQKELIGKQREITHASANNTEELRKISDKARSDTSGLLDQNEGILEKLSIQLEDLKNGGGTDAEILQAEQLKAQSQAAVNQLRAGLRNLDYATNTDNPPTNIADLQKEVSLKQLDLQEKALSLSKEAGRIQYNLALVQASLMRPASPFAGTVEKIYVYPGQTVNPGTKIAVISSNNPEASLSVLVPQDVAKGISLAEPSILHISGKQIQLNPAYVSSVATNNLLYTVLYNLPEAYVSKVADNSFVPIDIPIGYADSTASVPFVPIDTVFQSQNASYVFVVENGMAKVKEVRLGSVYGSFVEVVSGIKDGDKIILNRNVVDGEKVSISN